MTSNTQKFCRVRVRVRVSVEAEAKAVSSTDGAVEMLVVHSVGTC